MDGRKMRGMEIANTIGNPSAKAVSIKRLNKLAYKVRSQTNIDQWYNVINTYDDGWIYECLDFQARHQHCNPMHEVAFSKLLRKNIYQRCNFTTTARITGKRSYNFIRPHMALENKTPAEEAGIKLPLGQNKVETLMRLAAVNKNDIAQLLGFRINKVKVNKHADYVEIKPNGWLDKRMERN
jgi:hypothetical protein